MENNNLYIGELIKTARLNKEMNQEDLANNVGCSLNTISRWENNYNVPPVSELQKISKILDVNFVVCGDKYYLLNEQIV